MAFYIISEYNNTMWLVRLNQVQLIFWKIWYLQTFWLQPLSLTWMSRKSQNFFSAQIKNKCFVSGTGTDSTNTQLSSWIWAPYGGQLFEKRTTIHAGCHRKQKSAYNDMPQCSLIRVMNKTRGISAKLRLTLWLKRQSFFCIGCKDEAKSLALWSSDTVSLRLYSLQMF